MAKQRGITIVSLVVTIILLIILAGVSISAILGENGIITMAKKGKENVELSQIKEQTELNELYMQMESEVGTSGGISYDIMAKFIKFKQIIAEAITNKGVETKETDSAETMAENIGKLESRQESEKTVIYYIDTDDIQMQKFIYGESVLGTSFVPRKEGYTFVGWREDDLAQNDVLTEKIMEKEGFSLYAVFRKNISVTYNANGGDSTPTTQNQYMYYNYGNVEYPTFILPDAITKTEYNFQNWAMGSTSGEKYSASDSVTLSSDTVFYATWKIKPKYLFKSGGGGTLNWSQQTSTPASSEITSSYIHTLSDGNTGQCLVYSSLVDVTNYTYLKVDLYQYLRQSDKPGHSTIGLATNTSFNESMNYTLQRFNNNWGRGTATFDISSITGSYRVKFWSKHDDGGWGTHTYIYNIWLE